MGIRMYVGLPAMTPRSRYTFFIDEEQKAALTEIKERVGISESEQIRRAVKAWIEENGVSVKKKTAPRRATTRRKA